MANILANDGLHPAGLKMLIEAGMKVSTEHIAQEELTTKLLDFDGIVVRSATRVPEELIRACPNLSLIGRAGVGMDNIDVEFAQQSGIKVVNTPGASSQSVAELVFAHMFSMARFLYASNRNMPNQGATDFSALKKSFSKGIELRGKTLGVIGFGRIGQAVARMGLGLGMNVMPFKLYHDEVKIAVDFFKIKEAEITIKVKTDPFEDLLAQSDFITLHVPFPKGAPPVLYKERFGMMKKGVFIINASRGGVVVENDLIEAIDSGQVAAAALDVFEGEPMPSEKVLQHPRISLTPHIGASTVEAQERIGTELAEKIIDHFKTKNA